MGLDFDGTLSPLVARPDWARLPEDTRRVLRVLARRPGIRIAFVSGRELGDVKRLVGIRGCFYAGNHGLEIEGPGAAWKHPRALRALPVIREARRRLGRELAGLRGVLLEDKGLTLTVHYRMAGREQARRAAEAVRSVAESYPGALRVAGAKKALELRPAARWDKGHSLRRIAGPRMPAGSILFIGDDQTDESGFRTLGPRAITVRVGGSGPSSARHRLRGIPDVLRLLRALADSAR